MRNITSLNCFTILLLTMLAGTAIADPKKAMPREDVVEVPAIGEGLCVHNLFQTNMVIQRDKLIIIWGWATPKEKVTVSFSGKEQTATTTKDRSWKVTFPAMSANATPAQLTVKGKEKEITLDNILIGDVWILGGQSNMEFPLDKVENGQLEVVSANFPEIRILTVPAQNGPEEKEGFARLHEWSDWSSRHFRKGDWDVCSPEIVKELSAIGYVFARRIHMTSRIPIGVIDASRGGTSVETWTPVSVLKQIGTEEVNTLLAEWDEKIASWDAKQDLENRIRKHEAKVQTMKERGEKIPPNRTVPTDLRPGPAMDKNRPGTCFNSMIAPIAGLSVKGAIFHQGFNNALGGGSDGAAMYHQIFGKMIASWRASFNDPEMPFGIISLCTAGSPQSRDDYLEKMVDNGVYIREAQYKTFLDLYKFGNNNIGFASSFDKRRSWYHPRLKIPVGERIARWALATQYGLDKEIKWRPPMYTEMKVENGKISLHMDTNVGPVDDGPIVGFAIAGEDRRFQPADANWFEKGRDKNNRPQTDRSVVVLSSPHVPNPIHFRYAWGRNPMGNLQSTDHNDLPFATQRSDDWRLEEVPDKYYANPKSSARDRKRELRSQAQKELRLSDMERRLKEAWTFIEENKDKTESERKNLEEHKAKQKEKYGGE